MAALAALMFSCFLAAPQQAPVPPTAEPPHIEWQRNLADALAIQKATGLPLLIAVNMNGERFNDLFATQTYKDKDFIESTRGYICVVASPDRHTERDYDALGNRVECPRFPGCTCSEHIQIEPELYARWFDSKRNAPRHLGISPDGKVLFDRFLDASMQTAIDAIAQHRGDPKKQPGPSQDLGELFARRDALARRTIERMWKTADAAQKQKLLAAANAAKNEPTDLLRAALREEDAKLSAAASLALARHGGKDAVIDLEDALARTDDPAVVRPLVERLAELGKTDPAAARLAEHFAPAKADVKIASPWGNPWASATWNAEERGAIEAELDRCEAALKQHADDDAARLALATAQLALGDLLLRDGGKGADLWFGDAASNAKKVKSPQLLDEAKGALAYALHMSGDFQAAGDAVQQAQGAAPSTRQPSPYLAARVLELAVLATAHGAATDPAAAEKSQSQAIARVMAMLAALREHHALREAPVLAAASLLEVAGLRSKARELLADAVRQWPTSAGAHERWRNRLIIDFGAESMRKAYAAYVQAAADKPTAEWFAGLGALTAAQQHSKDERVAEALAAYGEAIDRFARSAAGNADYADTANHYAVLALAGRAETEAGRNHDEQAVADLLRALALRPASLDDTDGLQRKPRAIAMRVRKALQDSGKNELADKLKPFEL